MYNLFFLLAMAGIVIGIQFGMRMLRAYRMRHWADMGAAAYQEQRYEDGLRAFGKCVRIAPEWLHARAMMSMCMAHTGRRDAALREIEMVQALQPREGETWMITSLFYALCIPEDHDKLLNALETLCELDPQAAHALMAKPAFRQFESIERFRLLRRRIKEGAAAKA